METREGEKESRRSALGARKRGKESGSPRAVRGPPPLPRSVPHQPAVERPKRRPLGVLMEVNLLSQRRPCIMLTKE